MRERFHPKYRRRGPRHVHLRGLSDREFEHLVSDALARSSAYNQPKNVTSSTVPTRRSGDQGRDIVITEFHGRNLLGFKYRDPPGTIIVECKLASRPRLPFEHISANLLQLRQEQCSAFMLVTNSTLTPRSIALAMDHCARAGARFQLIDARNFDLHLAEPCATRGIPVGPVQADPGPNQLQVSYQVLRNVEPEGVGFTVHVVVRSFGPASLNVNIGLHSTREWSDAEGARGGARKLLGDDLTCFTLRLRPAGAKVRDEAKLVLSVNDAPELFTIRLTGSDDWIDLPLFGDLVGVVESYIGRLRNGKTPNTLHLHAPSGTGKTRFLTEVARYVGADRVLWLRVREDGTALLGAPSSESASLKRIKAVRQEALLKKVEAMSASESSISIVFIDDLHLATRETIERLEALVFQPSARLPMILCGRSDPPYRQPRYEAFAQLVRDHAISPHQEQATLGKIKEGEVAAILRALIPGQPHESLANLAPTAVIRPVELVQYIHSLLERGFVYWVDENQLGLYGGYARRLGDGSAAVNFAELLNARLEFLDSIRIGEFSLTEAFAILALIDQPSLTFVVIEKLRNTISPEIFGYWFREDAAAQLAFVAHDTITEALTSLFYSFERRRNFAGVLGRFPEIRRHLSSARLAAIKLHDGDFEGSVPEMAKTARAIRPAKNLSSLSLEEVTYQDVGALVFLLSNKSRPCPALLCRALIARAYLDIHQRDFVQGVFDCIRLMTQVESLPLKDRKSETRLAIRQLVAHGLLNSGDLRTALSLMHEVENSIRAMPESPLLAAVEFDMCDRLQSYYTQQSAFEVARSFLFRGRSRAYRSRDQSLISISLSAEFHLVRYVDAEEALRAARRQLRHAKEYAPPRSLLHAEINYFVASWAKRGTATPQGSFEVADRVHSISEEKSYGHLVPRIDYLRAVNGYFRFERNECSWGEVEAMISKTRRSAMRYGYGEYAWLSDNLDLIGSVARGAVPGEIVEQAVWLIDRLARDGLNFIAEDYLCYQNIVALSNALRALYQFSDEARAWRESEKVLFSPLMCVTKEDRATRLSDVFDGSLLCRKYDSAAVCTSQLGYFIVLV